MPNKLITKYHNGGIQKLSTPAAYLTVSPGIDINKITAGFKSTLDKQLKSTGTLPKTPTAISSLGLDLLGQAPQLLDAGLQVFGGKKAETASGTEEFIMGGMDMAAGALLKSGNPLAMAGGALLTGLTAVNKYTGTTAKKQGTIGLDTGGYSTQMNTNAGKKQTLLGTLAGKTKRADALTKQVDRTNLLAGNAAYQNKTNLMASQNFTDILNNKNQQKLFGGIGTNILTAKTGAKINPKQLSNIKKKAQYKVTKAQEGSTATNITTLQTGGIITSNDVKEMNVIPEGALHARKHNLPEEIASQVTDKGIPVITQEEGGKITQHAEIEHSEIIFTKSVSKQLEEWFKEYNETENNNRKKELELECGKFLTSEILENTDDRVGLIEQV